MLRVRQGLCRGCSLCVESCPRQAISIISARAKIDQGRCNQCRLCLDVCPQGAIVEIAPVSEVDLATTVNSLRQKTDDLMKRIEKLRQQNLTTNSVNSGRV